MPSILLVRKMLLFFKPTYEHTRFLSPEALEGVLEFCQEATVCHVLVVVFVVVLDDDTRVVSVRRCFRA